MKRKETMVGFKTTWLILSLLFLAACVPQSKQTSCKSNEAFSPALRTCVPIVGGPSSFISIDSFLPVSTLTKYKNDTNPMSFSVQITNPYAQAYVVEWVRQYNGSNFSITPDSDTSYTFPPSILSTEVGTHNITVRIRDMNNVIVDSHNFQIIINDSPKPIIDSVSVVPPTYNLAFTPNSANQIFSFTVKNNNSAFSLGDYSTVWTAEYNGIQFYTESDPFTTSSSSGSNFPAYTFNPSALSVAKGLGNYTVRARVTNTLGEVVAERQWAASINHPTKYRVTSRDIYAAPTTPVAYSTVTTAYNGIPYTIDPTRNFIPLNMTAQGQYCVTLQSGAGVYPADSKNIKVNYYLDGTLIYTGTTTDADSEVCLSDSPDKSNIVFTNTSPTTTQAHTITARVYDEAISGASAEYTASDLSANIGTYPITWDFLVKPTNAAPTVTFTALPLTDITCGAASPTSKACTVTQDKKFTVGIHATDDFYSTTTDLDRFTYSMVLHRNGLPMSGTLTSCTKTALQTTPSNALGSDHTGPDYLCEFLIPSFDSTGSVNPYINTYNVSIIFSDTGSPITGSTAMAGTTLNYNLTVVNEASTPPRIDPQGITVLDSFMADSAAPNVPLDPASNPLGNFILEGQTLNINVLVTDDERDDHRVAVYLCQASDSTCAASTFLTDKIVTKTDGAATTLTTLTYTLPEDLVEDVAIGTSVAKYFKIAVTDAPDYVAGVTSATSTAAPVHFSVNVQNKNPAPKFDGPAVPLKLAAITTMVGYPLKLDPGPVSDASLVTSENIPAFQWYIDATGGDDSYVAIPDATSQILNWTPTNAIPSGTKVNLVVCASDKTIANPQPALGDISTLAGSAYSINGPNCFGYWEVTVKQNAVALNYDGGLATDIDPDVAVWQDTTVAGKKIIYTAYSSGQEIYVEKTVFAADGTIYNSGLPGFGFQTVKFAAIDGSAATGIKDISISGTNEFLYVAYQAAFTGTPGSPKIRIRRIDKRSGATGVLRLASYHDAGKFGFRYTQQFPETSNPAAVTIPTTLLPGQRFTVTFNGLLAIGNTVTINGTTVFTATSGGTGGTLCAGGPGAGCSNNGNGTILANLINNSTDRNLQGFSATDLGNGTVEIYGAVGGESADGNANISNYVVGKLGKIVTFDDGAGWKWYLPFVDLVNGATLGNIRVASGGALESHYLNSTAISSFLVYSGLGAVSTFTNDIFTNKMVIASVDSASKATLSTYTIPTSVLSDTVSLFGGAPIEPATLRLSAPVTGNAHYFAAAKVLTAAPSTYEWMIGRYSPGVAPALVGTAETFSALASTTLPYTGDVLDPESVADVNIQPLPSSSIAGTEARILVSSSNGAGPTGEYDMFAVRFRADGKLSCDLCVPLTVGTQKLSPVGRIATAKIDMAMPMGSTGAVITSKDILIAAFGSQSSNVAPFRAQVGIYNAELESLSTKSRATNGDEGYRPPFIGQ